MRVQSTRVPMLVPPLLPQGPTEPFPRLVSPVVGTDRHMGGGRAPTVPDGPVRNPSDTYEDVVMTITAEDLPHAGRVTRTLHRRPSTRALRPAVARLAQEFHDMPGLQLTLDQAARLGGYDLITTEDALRVLVAAGVLVEAPRGAFRRADLATTGQ